jgi:heat shock protein HspQ
MTSSSAKFQPGQLIQHRLFEYRGVIVDVDPYFRGTEEWYANVARSRPPKDQPWYHVLVHGQDLNTYVAERNLEPDETGEPIRHVEVGMFFKGMGDGGYIPRRKEH